MKRHLFITGFMGAGKSKIGRGLAQNLGLPFIDTDKLIEQEAGMSIKAIFSMYGEAHFRELEQKIVTETALRDEPLVVSPGGGALLNVETFSVVRENGWIVYIRSSPQAILERVKHSNKRPLLFVPEGPDYQQRLLQKITTLLKVREPVYLQADLVFDRDGMEWQEAAAKLLKQVQKLREP